MLPSFKYESEGGSVTHNSFAAEKTEYSSRKVMIFFSANIACR